jgi:hypothetical protein
MLEVFMNSSFFPWCSTPRLECLTKDDGWCPQTIRKNIRAVPYCEDSKDLNKVKERVAYFRDCLSKNPHSNLSFQNKSLRLLSDLEKVTDLKLHFINTAIEIQKSQKKFFEFENSDIIMFRRLESARKALKACDQEIFTLIDLIKCYEQQYSGYQHQLQLISDLISLVKIVQAHLISEENQNLAACPTEIFQQILNPDNWEMSKIQSLIPSFSQMNQEQCLQLRNNLRDQLTSCQTELLMIYEMLKWMNSSYELVSKNKSALQNLLGTLNYEVHVITSSYSPRFKSLPSPAT